MTFKYIQRRFWSSVGEGDGGLASFDIGPRRRKRVLLPASRNTQEQQQHMTNNNNREQNLSLAPFCFRLRGYYFPAASCKSPIGPCGSWLGSGSAHEGWMDSRGCVIQAVQPPCTISWAQTPWNSVDPTSKQTCTGSQCAIWGGEPMLHLFSDLIRLSGYFSPKHQGVCGCVVTAPILS